MSTPERITVDLSGVPETMLWTLHNRASEAKRPGSLWSDPAAVRLYDAIDYDFERSFGKPDGSHALRSRMFDARTTAWMRNNPGGTVVELAAGLETAFDRCDDGVVNWVCIDLPDAMAVRDRLLPARPRCRHLALSALDPAWFDHVDKDAPVLVSAQGLFMYFEPDDVQALFVAMLAQFAQLDILFDTIPRWLSKKTLSGLKKTEHYTAPRMPWGIDRHEIKPTIRGWSPRITSVVDDSFGSARGGMALLAALARLPYVGRFTPSITHVQALPQGK